MDTIGAISPAVSASVNVSNRAEVLERVIYLVGRKSAALIQSPTSGDFDALYEHLRKRLIADGMQLMQIHLTGVSQDEVPRLFALELGLLLPSDSRSFETWLAVQNYAESSQLADSRACFVLTGLELVDESLVPALDRVLTLMRGVIPCLLAIRQPIPGFLKSMLRRHVWLRTELSSLTLEESAQEFASQLVKLHPELKLAEDGFTAIHAATQGDPEKLRRLAELAALAAEAEQSYEINADRITALNAELRPF